MRRPLRATIAASIGVAGAPGATNAEIEVAVAAAFEASRGWARSTSVADRTALVRKVTELHTQRKDEFAASIVREMSKPLPDAVGEVEFAAAIYEYYPTWLIFE